MANGSTSAPVFCADRIRSRNRTTEPRVGSSNLSGRADSREHGSKLDGLFDEALTKLSGWRRRAVARARRAEGRFLAAQRRAARLAVALVLVAFGAAGCTDEGATYETLRSAGYSEIQLTGYDMFACAGSDDTCTGFRANGPTGVPVRGAVGCGLFFKGCTIRVTGTGGAP